MVPLNLRTSSWWVGSRTFRTFRTLASMACAFYLQIHVRRIHSTDRPFVFFPAMTRSALSPAFSLTRKEFGRWVVLHALKTMKDTVCGIKSVVTSALSFQIISPYPTRSGRQWNSVSKIYHRSSDLTHQLRPTSQRAVLQSLHGHLEPMTDRVRLTRSHVVRVCVFETVGLNVILIVQRRRCISESTAVED